MEVRRNGTQLDWHNCREVQDTVCPVADKELVEETRCEEEAGLEACKEVNTRFLERCLKYRNCPEEEEPPVFVCSQSQCVSRRETVNCKVEGECVALENQFLCRDGLCQNLSRTYTCSYSSLGDQAGTDLQTGARDDNIILNDM